MLVKFVLFYLEQLQRYDTLKNVQFLSTLYFKEGVAYVKSCMGIAVKYCEIQEAQLSPRDRAMRRVNGNLANCHATVQKLLMQQVLTKSMI